jgi:hypothetical protein
MRNRYLSLTLLCVVVIVLSCPKIFAANSLTEKQALDILVSQIQKDKLYDSWTSMSCLSFVTEEKTKNHFDFAIHEKHGGQCPGDPNTYPVVDRFRVSCTTKEIYWYEPAEGNFLPYKEVLKAKQKR